MKAKCSHDVQIKCVKEAHYDQNMSFSMIALAKLPIARNCASECSTVCFHVADKGTCTNKGNLLSLSFLSTKCLTLLPIKEAKDHKADHLSSSAFQGSVQKEPCLLNTLKKKKKNINMLFAFASCSRIKAWSFDSGCPTIYKCCFPYTRIT